LPFNPITFNVIHWAKVATAFLPAVSLESAASKLLPFQQTTNRLMDVALSKPARRTAVQEDRGCARGAPVYVRSKLVSADGEVDLRIRGL
jgi:hypothetical protein